MSDIPELMSDIPELNDPSQPIPTAMLVDPEDRLINIGINARGFNCRVTVNRSIAQLCDDWETKIINEFGTRFILSSLDMKYDRKEKEEDRNTLYGTTIFELDDATFILYKSQNNTVYFHFWSASTSISKEYCLWIQRNLFTEKLSQVFNEETNQRELTFWGAGGNGYQAFNRSVVLFDYDEEFRRNYPQKTLEQLDALNNLTPPLLGGKIILLHGKPGTGKTSMLRALSKSWTDWCHSSYISDPEVFLGGAGAMLTVITWDYNSYISEKVKEENAYHLLIIEDADELIASNAKDRTGQALSRLLNIGDGLLGHSTNLLICITTNAPMSELNEAVIRHGRCLANIEFSMFNRTEALEWLTHQLGSVEEAKAAISKHPENHYSLAHLYSILSQSTHITKKHEEVATGVYL